MMDRNLEGALISSTSLNFENSTSFHSCDCFENRDEWKDIPSVY